MSFSIKNITTSPFIKKIGSKLNNCAEVTGKALNNALEKSPDKDNFVSKLLKSYDPTGANNAFASLASIMTFAVIIPRVVMASKRNKDNPEACKDEIKEILFRDVQTVLVCLFALKTLNSVVGGVATKKGGLPMTNKPYLKIFEDNGKKGLAKIKDNFVQLAKNPRDKLKNVGKNILSALHPTDGVRALTNDEFISRYSGFDSIEQISKMFDSIAKSGNPNKVFNKVMTSLIGQQEKTIKEFTLSGVDCNLEKMQAGLDALKAMKEKGYTALKDTNINEIAKNRILDYFSKENSLVTDGKKLNGALRTGALIFEAAYLGFGLPALNEKRLKKKYLKDEMKSKMHCPPPPRPITNDNAINAKEEKLHK